MRTTEKSTGKREDSTMRAAILGVVGLALATSMATSAGAQTCRRSCGTEVRTCTQAARTEAQACRATCSGSEARECRQDCTSARRAAVKSCRSGLGDCIGGCAALSPTTANCVGQCGQTLGECQQAVAT